MAYQIHQATMDVLNKRSSKLQQELAESQMRLILCKEQEISLRQEKEQKITQSADREAEAGVLLKVAN